MYFNGRAVRPALGLTVALFNFSGFAHMRFKACVLLAFFAAFLISETSFGQGSYDYFTVLTGSSSAKLDDGGSGVCKLTGVNKKLNALKAPEQRFKALTELVKSPRAASEVNRANKAKQTPLHFAIYACDGPAFTERLLESGADPNAALFGRAPIWHALALDNEYSTYISLSLLDYGADPNAAAPDGETPLHAAAAHNNFWVAQRLLELGANPNAQFNGKKASELATDTTLKNLFKNWGRRPYPYSAFNKGEPAICRAASRNNYWAVKRLLDKGADKNASWQGKKAADLTTDARVRQLLGGKGRGAVDFSDYRVEHIFYGEYDSANRHNSGGHSYSAFLYMDKCGLKPKAHAVYENGVMVCSVERHTEQRKADDPARPSHTVFPYYWTKGDIFEAINYLALENVDQDRIDDVYKGVNMTVILRDARRGDGRDVITAYTVLTRQPTESGKMERIEAARKNAGGR